MGGRLVYLDAGRAKPIHVGGGGDRRVPPIRTAVLAADLGYINTPAAAREDVGNVEERLGHAVIA